METKQIVVVGGGPAGMMAAIRAAQCGGRVILVEKNPSLGKKLLLSGKGRCNLTNACDLDSFLERFSRRGEFLRDAFKKFFNRDLMEFFESRGLTLKVERQLRVFPASDTSASILQVLQEELRKYKVELLLKSAVQDIEVKNGAVESVVLWGGKRISCESLILATGGASYTFTGSTGDGFILAKKSGHGFVHLLPGLVPLETVQKYPKRLEGLTLKNIRLTFSDGKKQVVSPTGELLFTDFGISGPLVLTLSGQVAEWLHNDKRPFVLVDLKPGLSQEQLDARLLREFKAGPKKQLKNTLKSLLPQKLVTVFLEIVGINLDTQVSHITQQEREKLVFQLKALRLDIARTRPLEEAMVTRGGVSLKDIDPRSMQSKVIKNLYFAGEMIDIDADTGGFNLQAAFSTGYLAGESAVVFLKR